MAFAYVPNQTAAGGSGEDDVTLTPENAPGVLRAIVERAVANKVMNPWCGICHSRDLTYEDGRTRFRTIEEARPFLEANEREQARARSILGQQGQN
jgi:hypothetical protein